MQSWRVVVVVMVLLGVWEIPPTAQRPTFRSTTELVNLNITVVGPDSQPIAGLTQEQFEVFEDGVRQTVKFFAPGELPLDVVILLDTSASMNESMALVRQAATRFVNALRPDDRVVVMGVATSLRVLQTLTHDRAAAVQAIAGTRAAGRTSLYVSIYTALDELKKIRQQEEGEARRQALVVLSDGVDTASGLSFDDLLTSVRRDGVPIYPIAPRPSKTIQAHREAAFGESTHEQDFELRKLAAETGGRAFFPVVLHELAGVYGDIAEELTHQYALGYESSNANRDGAFRRIALRIAVPGARWRTRSGYLAARQAVAGY